MDVQYKALTRLKVLILALTAFLLIFSVSGFVMLDVYLLSTVSDSRMDSIDRTRSYLQPFVRTLMMLRSLHLAENQTADSVPDLRDDITTTAKSMLAINTLNFVSPPSQSVADYLARSNLSMRIPVSGAGAFVSQPTNFLDLINECVSSLLAASLIDLVDLQHADYSINSLTVSKRAIVFLCDPSHPPKIFSLKEGGGGVTLGWHS
jgi:hypothetical protein